MIVCSCNVLTDRDIRAVMSTADELPRTTYQVYGCLGCRVECGRCVGTIRTIMDRALRSCDKTWDSGSSVDAAPPIASPDRIVLRFNTPAAEELTL